MDDVINVSGHRLGTAEVEDVLVSQDSLFQFPHFVEIENTVWTLNILVYIWTWYYQDEHPMVAEVAVVGYPHDIKGEGKSPNSINCFSWSTGIRRFWTTLGVLYVLVHVICALNVTGVYAYITLKEHVTEPHEQIEAEMRAHVKQKIASYAVPDLMQVKHRENLHGIWLSAI